MCPTNIREGDRPGPGGDAFYDRRTSLNTRPALCLRGRLESRDGSGQPSTVPRPPGMISHIVQTRYRTAGPWRDRQGRKQPLNGECLYTATGQLLSASYRITPCRARRSAVLMMWTISCQNALVPHNRWRESLVRAGAIVATAVSMRWLTRCARRKLGRSHRHALLAAPGLGSDARLSLQPQSRCTGASLVLG